MGVDLFVEWSQGLLGGPVIGQWRELSEANGVGGRHVDAVFVI